MREPRVEDHGVIGDGRSAALVARDGSVTWLCWPTFDSPALFASLGSARPGRATLGASADASAARGGRFRVAPVRPLRSFRRYVERTNVLDGWFDARAGTLRVRDAMTIAPPGRAAGLSPEHELLRIATCVRGEVDVAVEVDLRGSGGRAGDALRRAGALGLRAEVGRGAVALRSEVPLEVGGDGVARGRAALRAGQEVAVSLSYEEEAPAPLPLLGAAAAERMAGTVEAWRAVARGIAYAGPHRDAVVRSALALALVVFAPSGAVVAAASAPGRAQPGGDRSGALRDAALTARALHGLGLRAEAERFVARVLDAPRPRDLEGCAEVVGAAAEGARRGGRLDADAQDRVRALGDAVASRWRDPDAGGGGAPGRLRTHAVAMGWVALARLVELSRLGLVRRVRIDACEREMAAMREAVERDGFDPALGSYVAELGGHRVEAALLRLAGAGYAPAVSPRMRGTWRAIRARLDAGHGLLHRDEPGRSAGEGAPAACGFWAVELLARGGGTLAEAAGRLRDLLAFENDLGLLAEGIDPDGGEPLGGFPHAAAHVGLVSAALAVAERARGETAGRSPALPWEPGAWP